MKKYRNEDSVEGRVSLLKQLPEEERKQFLDQMNKQQQHNKFE
jgi:Mg/Co/Ni transporter MgtE